MTVCQVCGKPIRQVGERWLHEPPYDPFAPPIHAPRPRGPITAADLIGDIADGNDQLP